MIKTTFSFSRSLRPLSLLALVAALGATACKTEIIGGGGDVGGGGEGGTGTINTFPATGGTGGTTGGAGGVVAGVAEWATEMNEIPPGGSPGFDPDSLFIKIGNNGATCGGTFSYGCNPGVVWQVSIGLPPTMQGPGIYALANPAISATSAETGGESGGPGGPSECWAGAGQFTEGQIEVLSNDGATIVVRLSGTSQFDQFDADGDYAVPICPTVD